MSNKRACLWVFVGTAFVLFCIPYAESGSEELEIVAIALAGLSVLGTISSVVLAGFAFRNATLRTVRITAFWAAVLPFALLGMIALSGQEPNIHGFSIPALFFYALVSVSSALIFVIVAEFKKQP